MEDNGIVSGIDLVSQCRDIFDIYDIKSEIIAASMRNPRQVREAALAGAHIATIPFNVIKQAKPYCCAIAAIQISFSGIGLPFVFNTVLIIP